MSTTALALPQILTLSLGRVSTWHRVRRLKAVRASALKNMDVSNEKIANELAVRKHFQDIEMWSRYELRSLGVEVPDA